MDGLGTPLFPSLSSSHTQVSPSSRTQLSTLLRSCFTPHLPREQVSPVNACATPAASTPRSRYRRHIVSPLISLPDQIDILDTFSIIIFPRIRWWRVIYCISAVISTSRFDSLRRRGPLLPPEKGVCFYSLLFAHFLLLIFTWILCIFKLLSPRRD